MESELLGLVVKSYTAVFDNSNVKGNRIKSLFVDSENRLWIGSANDGISVYNFNDSTWRYLAYSAGNNNTLSGNDIEDIVEDENYIWVATNNSGLNRVEKATFRVKHIFKEDGLASNSLRRIVIAATDISPITDAAIPNGAVSVSVSVTVTLTLSVSVLFTVSVSVLFTVSVSVSVSV